MKIAFLTDTHCGIRNSSDIFIEYQNKFYSEIFFPYLLKHNIKHIIHTGDMFDNRRAVNIKALYAHRKYFLEPLVENGITLDAIPGNHDTYMKNTNEICSLKELLGYFVDNVTIFMEPTVVEYDGLRIALIPWINSENEKRVFNFIESCKADFVAGHFEFGGFEVMRGIEVHEGLSTKPFSRFELVISGHYHTQSRKGNIMYLGAPMEYFWNDCDDPKYFYVLDTETRELEAIRNPLTLFKKHYYDDEQNDYSKFDVSIFKDKFVKVIVRKRTDAYQFEKFIESIQQLDIHDLKIDDTILDHSSIMNNEEITIEDTSKLLESYINGIHTNLDKRRLNKLAQGLYIEAVNMDF